MRSEAYPCQSHEQNSSIKNNFSEDISNTSDRRWEDQIGTSKTLWNG